MNDTNSIDVQTSYDRIAQEYVARIFDEIQHKPLDRTLLDRFAEKTQGNGLTCDLGCGPGHVARYLHERGLPVMGVDLSPVMVETARRLNPEIEFAQSDMRALKFENETFAGIAAFYSIIHIPRSDVISTFIEMKRVLKPGGVLLIAFHIGDEILHLDEMWGQTVSVDFIFFRPDEMTFYLNEAGFEAVEVIEREPYPDVEHQSRRAYLFARKSY